MNIIGTPESYTQPTGQQGTPKPLEQQTTGQQGTPKPLEQQTTGQQGTPKPAEQQPRQQPPEQQVRQQGRQQSAGQQPTGQQGTPKPAEQQLQTNKNPDLQKNQAKIEALLELYVTEVVYANLRQVGILPEEAPEYFNPQQAFGTITKYIIEQPFPVLALIQKKLNNVANVAEQVLRRELVVILRLVFLNCADEITKKLALMDRTNAITTLLQEINLLTMRGIQNLPPIHRGIVGLNNMKFEQDAKICQPPNIFTNIFKRILNFLLIRSQIETFVNDPVEIILKYLVLLQKLEQERQNAHPK